MQYRSCFSYLHKLLEDSILKLFSSSSYTYYTTKPLGVLGQSTNVNVIPNAHSDCVLPWGLQTADTVSQVVTNTASQKKQLKQKTHKHRKIFCKPRVKRRPTNADMQRWHCLNELKSMLKAVGVCIWRITKQGKDNVCRPLSTCERGIHVVPISLHA